jgi:hypothetical protein
MIKNTINLENNGRLFPSWINENFKKYILPEVINKDDPCNEKRLDELTLYQKFIGDYLNYQSPFKEILIYHGVGAGKTNSAINIYNILFNYTPKWNVFILIPAALHDDPWLKDLNKWLDKKDNEIRMKNIIFIHYDSPFADRDFLDKVKKADSSKSSIFIIDEVHRFMTNVYNNVTSKKGKRAQVIYDYIQQEKKENSNTRVILLSATPVVNNPFEFALIFNLLRPGTFPTSESLFEQLYISSSNFMSLNENTKNLFQRRIMGLVSYYIGATPDKFAEKTVNYVNIEMDPYYQEIYDYYEKIEEEKERLLRLKFRGKVGNDKSTYSSYTRQACNFIFPYISDKINGEKRPRPSHFKISDEESKLLEKDEDYEKKKELLKDANVLEYLKTVQMFINSFIDYIKDKIRIDKDKKHTLNDDINNYIKKYNYNYEEFHKKEKNKSNTYNALYTSSPKIMHIIFNIIKTKGTVLIYSNYVQMEGLQLLKIYLHFFNFISYSEDKDYDVNKPDKNNNKDTLRYVEYHGGIDKYNRELYKKIFNKPENKYGKYIKIIMISPAGAEGVSLNNVRQVHIMEPYWNEVRIEQVIGRAIRMCHHKDLPLEERKVDVFRYKMIRKNLKETTDERMENISRRKNNLLLSFIEAVKEVSIDCELFKNHNMMGNKYKCFQFDLQSLFEKPIGPAYNKKIEYDIKMDNGLNSKYSDIVKIKVRKIKAVKLEDNTYSKEDFYWFDDETGICYDYLLNHPIGKVGKDETNNYLLLQDDIYIINNIIDIPITKLYS